MSGGRTRITCTDIDTGESESVEIGPDQFLVVLGGNRLIHSEQVYGNGTNVVTIKRAPKP